MRILVVEDEHKIAGAIKKGLEQDKYAVDVEYDADAGYGAALNEPYDLMIIDRMLPGSMEGLDIARRLREKNIHTPPEVCLTSEPSLRHQTMAATVTARTISSNTFLARCWTARG